MNKIELKAFQTNDGKMIWRDKDGNFYEKQKLSGLGGSADWLKDVFVAAAPIAGSLLAKPAQNTVVQPQVIQPVQQAQPQVVYMPQQQQQQSSMPSWLLPAGIGLGLLLLLRSQNQNQRGKK